MDLTAKYQAINQRGTELLLAGGDIDPWLSDRAADRRRGLSLIFTLPAHVSRNISCVRLSPGNTTILLKTCT